MRRLSAPKGASRTACAAGLFTLFLMLTIGCSGPTTEVAEPEAAAPTSPEGNAKASITILTTNAADVVGPGPPSQGEWSFSAWVEVDGRSYLFDSGWSPRNVLTNAEVLGIDLSTAEDVVLSHHHKDHTGGLETLRAELSKRDPKALSRIHVAEGIFASRPGPDGAERNPMIDVRKRVEATGATFIIHNEPAEIAPDVWVTGPVERVQ